MNIISRHVGAQVTMVLCLVIGFSLFEAPETISTGGIDSIGSPRSLVNGLLMRRILSRYLSRASELSDTQYDHRLRFLVIFHSSHLPAVHHHGVRDDDIIFNETRSRDEKGV